MSRSSTTPSPPTLLASPEDDLQAADPRAQADTGERPETIVEVEAPGGPTGATGNNPGNKLSENEGN